MSADVVPIGVTPLTDIPGMLREAADTLERAIAEGKPGPDVALLVLSTPEHRAPCVRCYGRNITHAEADGLLMHAILYPAIGVQP